MAAGRLPGALSEVALPTSTNVLPEGEVVELPEALAEPVPLRVALGEGDSESTNAPTRSPLAAKLLGAVAVTLAYSAHAAAGLQRSSVNANA